MTPGADLDRIAAESRRRSAAVLDELTAANARTAATAADLATRSTRAIEALQRHRPQPERPPPGDPAPAPGEPEWPASEPSAPRPASGSPRPESGVVSGEPEWPASELSDPRSVTVGLPPESGTVRGGPQWPVSSGYSGSADSGPEAVSTYGAPSEPDRALRGTEPEPGSGRAPETGGRHAAPDPDETTRPLWRAPGPDDAEAGTAPLPVVDAPAPSTEERRLEELRERRDAIARSIAARRAQGVARPSDQDDEEGEYYRRTSWLI